MPDGITLAEVALACLVAVLGVPVVWLVARRRWLATRGWVFDCSLRISDAAPSASWRLGVARLNGELVQWYRVYSLSLRPALVIRRGGATVASTRTASEEERAVLVDQTRIALIKHAQGAPMEIAMRPEELTAFLSWLEAAPPGLSYR